jgi:hypothetical protein
VPCAAVGSIQPSIAPLSLSVDTWASTLRGVGGSEVSTTRGDVYPWTTRSAEIGGPLSSSSSGYLF